MLDFVHLLNSGVVIKLVTHGYHIQFLIAVAVTKSVILGILISTIFLLKILCVKGNLCLFLANPLTLVTFFWLCSFYIKCRRNNWLS